MLFVCHSKILHKHCLRFLLGVKMAPRETENNAYAKFGVTNKEHYGMLWYFLEWSIGLINLTFSNSLDHLRPKSLVPLKSRIWKCFFYFGIKPIKVGASRSQLTLKCFISDFPVVWKKERKTVKMYTKKTVIANVRGGSLIEPCAIVPGAEKISNR